MPTALILDIHMPIADGFEVLYHMRGKGLTGVIPVMVLTARNRPEDVRNAIDLGEMDFLAKQFKDAHLLARVARLLRRPVAKGDVEGMLPSTDRRGSGPYFAERPLTSPEVIFAKPSASQLAKKSHRRRELADARDLQTMNALFG